MNTELLLNATAFVWAEADMLDHAEYKPWQALWEDDGLYIVPIDAESEDFVNTLNFAYDDAAMRAKRIARLDGGESVSMQPRARTVRSVSRLRIIESTADTVTIRGAQDLREFRKEGFHQHTADVTWNLVRRGDSWRLKRKVVRIINSMDTLTTLGYLL